MFSGAGGHRLRLVFEPRSLMSFGSAVAVATTSCFAGVVLLLVPACGTSPPAVRPRPKSAAATSAGPSSCKEPELRVLVRGSDRLNVDEFGRSLAVVVRIYQLKTARTLEDAEFDHIWQHDKESLADDVMSVNELTVAPSEVRSVPLKRFEDAHYVAVVGLFRKPDGIAWRAIRLIPIVCRGEDATMLKKVPKEIALEFLAEDYRIEIRS